MGRRIALAAVLAGLLAVPAWGQRRAMGPAVRSGFAPRSSVFVGGGFGFRGNPRFVVGFNQRAFFFRGQRRFFYPYYWPAVYGGYAYGGYPYAGYPYAGYPYAGYSNPVVVQAPPTNYQPTDYADRRELTEAINRLSDEVYELRQQRESQAATARPQAAVAPGPATILVYRDKHLQEVRDYAIVGQTLWVFNEQRASKIPLNILDLNSTAKLNDERGVEFQLPR